MGIIQAIRMSFESIWSNKMRSFLTTLGIIIGVAAVISLVSVVDSVTNMITNTLKEMGTNSITVMITGKGTTKELQVEEMMQFIEENPKLYDGIAPNLSANVVAKNKSENVATKLTGTTPTYQTVNNITLSEGRFLNSFDIEGRQKVAVVGSYVKKEIFGDQPIIGKQIKINGEVFDIIGVVEEKQGSVQSGADDVIYLPYTTAQRLVKDTKISTYTIQGSHSENMTQAKEKLSVFLKKKLGTEDAFIAISQDEILGQVNTITGTMTTMLGGIAAISLIVGGIGIMNIMLVSVTERTKEIGIRKAIGAKRRNILIQFLIESIVLSLLGGCIGIMVGWLLTKGIGEILEVETTVSFGIIVFSVTFSMIIGVFFGLYPASKASKLNPIDALHYE